MNVRGHIYLYDIKTNNINSLYFSSAYSCHGSWTENGTVFIIARHAGSQHGVCISFRPQDIGVNNGGVGGNGPVQLIVGDACYRGTQPLPDHHLRANLTTRGKWKSNYLPRITSV